MTQFEKKVYRAVLRIPLGEVRSYAWVARAIGHPGAARAVGTALRKNPFAPFVPCHRVIKEDGALGRYSGRGGSTRKARLLAREKHIRIHLDT